MSTQDEIIEAVDQIADSLDLDAIEETAERLELTVGDLMARVASEIAARLA